MASQHIAIEMDVNGLRHHINVAPGTTLLEVLREQLNLKGTKQGCGNGECGACTVIMDGKAVNACLVLAVRANNKSITTIEGLASNRQLHPIQKKFIEIGAVQCGFCTPGMIISAKALLDETSEPDGDDIKEALSGNLCRCSGYQKIVQAVTSASQRMKK